MTQKPWHQYKRLWLLLLITAYLLLGFFYVPGVIQQQLQRQLHQQLGQTATVQEVNFNPLTFNTHLQGLTITDTQQQSWFKATELAINFDPLNLLWGQWRFADLQMVQPVVTIQTSPSGQWVVPMLATWPASDASATPIDLVIDDIDIEGGRLNLMLGNIRRDLALNIKRWSLHHEKFVMADEATEFDLSFTTEFDETIKLKGDYNHQQQRINSEFQLIDWQATSLNHWLPEDLPVSNQTGLIQARGQMEWVLTAGPLIDLSEVSLSGWHSRWQQHLTMTDLSATLTGIKIDTNQNSIQVAEVLVPEGQWQINWPWPTDDPDPSPPADTPQNPWLIHVDQVRIDQWPVTLNDTGLGASLAFTLRDWTAQQINSRGDPMTINGTVDLAAGGRIELRSEQLGKPWTIDSELKLTDLNLAQFNAWIADQTGLRIDTGRLHSQQHIQLVAQYISAVGQVTIEDLNIENTAQQNIAAVTEVVGTTQLSSADKTVVLDQITLDQANGSLSMAEDKALKIQPLTDEANDEANDTAAATLSADTTWVIKIGQISAKDSTPQ